MRCVTIHGAVRSVCLSYRAEVPSEEAQVNTSLSLGDDCLGRLLECLLTARNGRIALQLQACALAIFTSVQLTSRIFGEAPQPVPL